MIARRPEGRHQGSLGNPQLALRLPPFCDARHGLVSLFLFLVLFVCE